MSYTKSSPILTISGIDSIHNLHSFFKALLTRSARSSMASEHDTTCITGNSETTFLNSPNTSQSKPTTPLLFKRNPKTQTKLKSNEKQLRGSGRRVAKRSSKIFSTNTQSTVFNQRSDKHLNTPSINFENCSLEELFFNIDRIIANDFLEPLSNDSNDEK